MALRECCGCAPLPGGTLVIASLYLAINILGLLGWSLFTIIFYAIHQADVENGRARGTMLLIVYILIAIVPTTIACIITNSFLILGVQRRQRRCMLPWIVWYAIFTIILQALWIFGCGHLLHLIVGSSESGVYRLVSALFGMSLGLGIFLFTVMWYWYACVVSYYMLLAPSDHYAMQSL